MKKLPSIFPLCAFALLLGTFQLATHAQVPTPPANDRIALQFPNTPIREVLEVYQQLTGKRIIRDPKIEQATVSIETSGELTKADAIIFMEKSLLLAGYAVVPSGENMVKVLAYEAGRKPSSEGVPFFNKAEDLPQTDQVVSYILNLNHLKSDEAAQAFLKIVPIHAYGDITPVPNSGALVITENSNTIRAIIEMAKRLDIAPSKTSPKTFQLLRADAKEVVEALNTLLGIGSTGTGTGAPGSSPVQRPVQPIQINNNPQQAAAMAAAQVATSTPQSSAEAEAAPPKLQAIERTNSVLAIARPIELEYIEVLIKELDAASSLKSFISLTLKYLDVSDFIVIAKDAIERYQTGDGAGSSTPSGGTPQTTASTTPASNFNNDSQGGFGQSGGGRGGMGGGGGGTVSMQDTPLPKPHSVRVGKTLLIAEPSRNELFASGPPEHLRVIEELIKQLDKRPKQIQLSVIIGEFTLNNDFRFGLDWINTLKNVGDNNLVGGVLKTTTNAGDALRDIGSIGGVDDVIPALQGLTVYGQIGDNLSVFLTALEQSNRFHVIQRPVVVTLNHKAANISTGLDLAIPGQTLTNSNNVGNNNNGSITSTTEYIPVRLSLGVIPHIFNDNEVKLELQQINSDVASYTTISGNAVPNISTQELKNTIIVPNQTTVLLGGLITERDRNDKSGLPWLVRIPVLKHLFGSTTKNKERRELMILVQPRILPDGESQIDAQMDITSQTQSYKATKDFAEPSSINPLLPLPVHDVPPASKIAPADLDLPPGGSPKVILKSTKK